MLYNVCMYINYLFDKDNDVFKPNTKYSYLCRNRANLYIKYSVLSPVSIQLCVETIAIHVRVIRFMFQPYSFIFMCNIFGHFCDNKFSGKAQITITTHSMENRK